MKKLFVLLALLFTAFLYAEPITKTYQTGESVYSGFKADVSLTYTDTFGKVRHEYPDRIYSIIPYQDGYLLKIAFADKDNYAPVLELFVKPGTKLNTVGNESTTVVSVSPNQIELKFVPREKK